MKTQEKKLHYPIATLTKLRESVHLRKRKLRNLQQVEFTTEVFEIAQCIAENSDSLRTKSDIFKRFPTCNPIESESQNNSSAIVFNKPKTIAEELF